MRSISNFIANVHVLGCFFRVRVCERDQRQSEGFRLHAQRQNRSGDVHRRQSQRAAQRVGNLHEHTIPVPENRPVGGPGLFVWCDGKLGIEHVQVRKFRVDRKT